MTDDPSNTEDALAARLLRLFQEIHPLDRVPRAGYVLRGVAEPESVAAHSHFVALMTLLMAEANSALFDRDKAVSMALIHDLCESRFMDIPMPSSDAYFHASKSQAEQEVTEDLLGGFGERLPALHAELLEAESPEARLVRGLDKAQMMVKVLMYEREGRGRLEEFWTNPRNFADFELEPVSALFDAICAEAGRERPR